MGSLCVTLLAVVAQVSGRMRSHAAYLWRRPLLAVFVLISLVLPIGLRYSYAAAPTCGLTGPSPMGIRLPFPLGFV